MMTKVVFDSALNNGQKQTTVETAIGIAIHLRKGRHLPHFVLVLSTILPMMGSLKASYILVKSMRKATAIAPSTDFQRVPFGTAPKRSASVIKIVRYDPMIVQMKFCPKPQMLYAIASFG